MLIKRDRTLLEAIYKVTHGCSGKFVTARDIAPFLQLSAHDAEIAVHRLISSAKVEENDYGYALTRRGVEAYEQQSVIEKRRSTVSNIFNFHGSASGVFGSNNDVQGNKFTSGEVPSHLIEKVLIAAAQLRTNVPQEQASQIDEAAIDVRDGIDDPDRLGRGTRRLAQIARALGEIGGPLLKAATDVMTALPG